MTLAVAANPFLLSDPGMEQLVSLERGNWLEGLDASTNEEILWWSSLSSRRAGSGRPAREQRLPMPKSYDPLLQIVRGYGETKLARVTAKAASLERDYLIKTFQSAFAKEARIAALVLAGALIAREIPPCFWRSHLSRQVYARNQKFDLLVYDLLWLRFWYPNHHNNVRRYPKYRKILVGSLAEFHYGAEHAFKDGKRSTCQMVRLLSMSPAMQLDCAVLHSDQVKLRIKATAAVRDRAFTILQDSVKAVRKTSTFDVAVAAATATKRFRLWLCSRLTIDSGPTAAAGRYAQMTGETITRQAVANQLGKVQAALRKNGVTLK